MCCQVYLIQENPHYKMRDRLLEKIKISLRKPIPGAVGQLAATRISKGVPALISCIINRKKIKQKSLSY